MFNKLFLIILSLFFMNGCHLTQTPESQVILPNTQVEIFHAKSIGDYKITTYWPNKPSPKAGWPIIYLLDGDSFFLTANNILSSQTCDRCIIQDGIIVAIDYLNSEKGYSRRDLDFLPKPDVLKGEILPNNKLNLPNQYGGADDFYDFLVNELKPAIEKRFTINPAKQAIFGHSYGGLFLLHTLLTKPIIFNNYIVSSPSLWFSDRYMMKELDVFIHQDKLHMFTRPINVMLSVGGDEESLTSIEKQLPNDQQSFLSQHRKKRQMIALSKQFYGLLAKANFNNLTLSYQIYANQSHKTAALIALQDGIQTNNAN